MSAPERIWALKPTPGEWSGEYTIDDDDITSLKRWPKDECGDCVAVEYIHADLVAAKDARIDGIGLFRAAVAPKALPSSKIIHV